LTHPALAEQTLYNVYAQLFKLRTYPIYSSNFASPKNLSYNLGNAFKQLIVTGDSLSVVFVGNFDVNQQSATVTFPTAGTWYSYLTSKTITASGGADNITLQPGEYYVYTNKNVNNTVVTAIPPITNPLENMQLQVMPNPAGANATVQFELPISGNARIDVYNIEGQYMANI
jgi:hypothetical protein